MELKTNKRIILLKEGERIFLRAATGAMVGKPPERGSLAWTNLRKISLEEGEIWAE